MAKKSALKYQFVDMHHAHEKTCAQPNVQNRDQWDKQLMTWSLLMLIQ